MTTNSVDTCQCQATTHGHEPNKCENPATGSDNLCKPCHDKAAVEASAAIVPLSEPVRRAAATTVGTGGATGVGAWLAPLPPDHPFYALVGRVASEWSHFEHILDLTIWDLARWKTEGFTHAMAACITAQITGSLGRCHAIESLGILRGIDDALLKRVRKLRQSAHMPGDSRARMVHDAWFIEEPSGKPGAFRAMPNLDRRFGVQEISMSKFDDLFKEIGDLQGEANEIRNAISHALHNKQT